HQCGLRRVCGRTNLYIAAGNGETESLVFEHIRHGVVPVCHSWVSTLKRNRAICTATAPGTSPRTCKVYSPGSHGEGGTVTDTVSRAWTGVTGNCHSKVLS